MSTSNFADALVAKVREIYCTDQFIPLHAPRLGETEKSYVIDAIDSTFVSSVGKNVVEFEEAIAKYTGARFAVAVSSGTAALHVALHAIGVRAGDEVITTPLTFVATCNAISYCGGSPIFVDVDRSTLGLSSDSLAQFLEEYAEVRDDGLCWNRFSEKVIRACVPVHNLGHPAQVEKIITICERYNIPVIEDAAESLGSYSGDTHTGRLGSLGTLSFNGNKIITTGGGGAIITDSERLKERVKHLTTTAKQPHPYLFIHDEIGFNYRLPNLNAALGLAQIEQLEHFVLQKRQLSSVYAEWLDDYADIRFFSEPAEARSNYWLNAILVSDRSTRDDILSKTNQLGVMTRPMWTPMPSLPMFENCLQFEIVNAREIENQLINLPSSVVSANP
ncbi:LegC family aminotransferase [Arenicellales bacterium IMCC57338]